jgi:cell division protein ZapA
VKKLDISVNYKPYQVICEDSDVDRVRQLADEVTMRAQQIAQATRHADETRILMMTCLRLADELYEAREEAGLLREQQLIAHNGLVDLLHPHDDRLHDIASVEQEKMRTMLETMIEKMQHIAVRLE